MTESMTFHSGPDPWNPWTGWRPIVIRKRWRHWHRPAWEVRIYGDIHATYGTGAAALAAIHRELVTAEHDAAADAQTHATPEDPT